MWPFKSKHERAELWYERGLQALDAGYPAGALRAARKLERMKYSGSFELEALARKEMGDLDSAIDVLRRGTSQVPTVWVLWQLLGNLLSENDSFGAAAQAFEHALTCPDVDRDSVEYNAAIGLARAGRDGQALERVRRVGPGPMQLLACSLEVRLLNQLGQHDEAIRLADQKLSAEWEDTVEDGVCLSRIESQWAYALQHSGDVASATRHVWEAIAYDKSNEEAMGLLRELRGLHSDRAHHFRIVINGVFDVEVEGFKQVPGFFTNCEVIADDETEALELIREFHPQELRGSIGIAESKDLGPPEERFKGVVYHDPGYNLYGRDLID